MTVLFRRVPKVRRRRYPKDPPGVWREELQCAGCGTCKILRTFDAPTRASEVPATMRAVPVLGPKCRGYFNGRPYNRCGWRTSRVFLFVPEQPL
jgi:hypothetical protein